MSSRHMNGLSARPSSASRTGERRSSSQNHHDPSSVSVRRNSNSRSRDDESATMSDDLLMECKAAFIAVVKGSTSKPLTSKSDLLLGKEFSLDSNVG